MYNIREAAYLDASVHGVGINFSGVSTLLQILSAVKRLPTHGMQPVQGLCVKTLWVCALFGERCVH